MVPLKRNHISLLFILFLGMGKMIKVFFAVWNQMPTYCRYCHEGGHAVAICPRRSISHTCWNCGKLDHIPATCPKYKPSKRARKQPGVTIAPDVNSRTNSITLCLSSLFQLPLPVRLPPSETRNPRLHMNDHKHYFSLSILLINLFWILRSCQLIPIRRF